MEDYGKVAATFVDTETGEGLRIRPHPEARRRARLHAPDAPDRWHTYLFGYQQMPADELLAVDRVELCLSLDQIISRPEKRAVCMRCDEEIINGREIVSDGHMLCASCAGHSYYRDCEHMQLSAAILLSHDA